MLIFEARYKSNDSRDAEEQSPPWFDPGVYPETTRMALWLA